MVASLKRLGLEVREEALTDDGVLRTDCEIRIGARRVAVEADGPQHFTANTHRPTVRQARCAVGGNAGADATLPCDPPREPPAAATCSLRSGATKSFLSTRLPGVGYGARRRGTPSSEPG